MAAVIPTVSLAIDLLVELIAQAQKISSIVQTAQAAGSTTLTAEQWAQITADDDSAAAALAAAIAAAKAGGR